MRVQIGGAAKQTEPISGGSRPVSLLALAVLQSNKDFEVHVMDENIGEVHERFEKLWRINLSLLL